MNNIQTISDRLTITSREVAELTGKEHSNVMRDIRAMLEVMDSNLNPCAISTTYMGKDGRYYPQYQLDKDTCLTHLLGDGLAAYQNHADAGRFIVKTGVAPNTEKAYTTTKFTPKGINWIAGEWGKYKLAKGQA